MSWDVGRGVGTVGDPDDPLRVGICSTAHLHAGAYAPVLASMGGVDLVGVADEDADRGRAFAGDHGIDYREPGALFDAVDAVVVTSTNVEHATWVERAAAAGVDVLCEKPLMPRPDAARDVVAACEEAGVTLGVAMPLRHSPPLRDARERLAALGRVRTITGTNRGEFPGGWFGDPERAGGGAVIDHTVHVVDAVHWLTGERVAEVYAETDTRFTDAAVEDVNLLSMELTDGTQFSLDGSWSRPDDWHFWGDATVEFVCEDGVVSVDCFDQTFTHTREGEGVASAFFGTDPNVGMLADFVEAVVEGRRPATTGPEGVEAVAVVAAAYESTERGEPVPVAYE
jgi:predicted dehydrogenase